MNKKIIFDTNILISVLLCPERNIAKVFKQTLFNYKVITSNDILEELFDVIKRDKFNRFRDLEERISWFNNYKKNIDIETVDITITDCEDPKDNKFLELAVSQKVSVIVSGDPHLLKMNPYKGIEILTITEYEQKYLSTKVISKAFNNLFKKYF